MPRLVIIDQGDKIYGVGDKDTSTTERLQRLYAKFRELAKEYMTDIITVGQASAEAQGKKWLELDHMNNSKTGKPGELDYAIGIGRTLEGEEFMRYIHLCKNKMLRGVHGKHQVILDTERCRYKDM